MGFFDIFTKKPQPNEDPQKKQPKFVKSGEWEISCNADGTPWIFYKKDKLWFDTDNAWSSPSSKYFLCEGYNGTGDESIALATLEGVIKTRKFEESISKAVVTDEGQAYAITEEGTLYIITPEKVSKRKLGNDDTEEVILTSCVAAAFSDDWNGKATIKGIDLKTGTEWKSVIKYEEPETWGEMPTIFSITPEGFSITLQDGKTRYLSPCGEVIEK